MITGEISRLAWSGYAFAEAQAERWRPYQPLDRILATQRRRVRRIVQFAWERVPAYREAMLAAGLRPRDFQTAGDLHRLPLIDARTYAANPAAFQPTPPDSGPRLTVSSSGTSGQSKFFHYDVRSLALALAHGHRQRHVQTHFLGRLAGCRELSLLRQGNMAGQIRRFYETHFWTPRGVDLVRHTIDAGAKPLAQEAAEIAAFRPDMIVGYGHYLGQLYRKIRARGLPCHVPRVFLYGAEAMPQTDREFLERQIGAPVVSTYQSAEALRIGFQCELRQGFHLSLDDVAVRIVDAAGREVPPGVTGEVVLSNLTNTATVLLNYRTGDLAVRSDRPCPCGRSLPILETIAGRRDDLLHLPGGRTVHALNLLARLRMASGVDRIQVVQEDARSYRIYAVADAVTPAPDIAARLSAGMDEITTCQNDVRVEWVDALPIEPSGKTRTLISRLPPPAEATS